ncbi:MAG: N-acetylmuramoyl-L-alanine amidase-like domain-containing protein [Verrucomicrobiota bacterium]
MKILFWAVGIMILSSLGSAEASKLPFEKRFIGVSKFNALKQEAYRKNWAELPIGERTAAVGKALVGIPYENFTLEIDNEIEAPSVNFKGMDCWTFFEIALAFARMLNEPEAKHTPDRLLHFIELDRYRGGHCNGNYLSRLHYLEDWAFDNDKRGLVKDLSLKLGGVRARIRAREMTILWKSYRYLKHNPSLVPKMKVHEDRIEKTPTYYIPRSKVKSIEEKLKNGDIIGIYSKAPNNSVATSHVGLALRDSKGVLRFMHATTQKDLGRHVAIDSRLSTYLYRFSKHRGIMVARPLR